MGKAFKRVLEWKYLPLFFALVAILFMLPAVHTGFMMDDFVQRIMHLDPNEIPPDLHRTGVVPDNTGTLECVIMDRFGFSRDPEKIQQCIDYGIAPWCLSENAKICLWRPFTAFTHWLDYKFFPDQPVPMHIHNIAWFALIILLVTCIYRKIIGVRWVAGLAALLFLLDPNTYFPVMFIANRGFIAAFCFGLLCFYTHHKWRSTGSKFAAILSFFFFAMSLLSNEAGVSTFAFLLAYALVLDESKWSKRFVTLLPAILITVVWRVIYNYLGYGTANIGAAYLDPGHEPLKFLYYFPGYLAGILGSQLSSIKTDALLCVNHQLFRYICMIYIVFLFVSVMILAPVVWRNKQARFWATVMFFAAIPIVAAPSGKNFAFIAVGAFGLIAVFFSELIHKSPLLPSSFLYKAPAWIFCIILLIAHIPHAIAGRIASTQFLPAALKSIGKFNAFDNIEYTNDSHIYLINSPTHLASCAAPVIAAYHNKPVPKTLRTLAYAYTGLEITRTDEKTLIIKSVEKNFFFAKQDSPIHFSHAFATMNQLFVDSKMFENNQTFELTGLTIEIPSFDEKGLPKQIKYTFEKPLGDKQYVWLQFDWYTFTFKPLELPEIGETVTIEDPPYVDPKQALHSIIRGLK